MAAVALAYTPPNILPRLLLPVGDELLTALESAMDPVSVALVDVNPPPIDASVVVVSVRVEPSSNICVAIIYLFRIFIGLIMYSYYLNK
jgi:hypothetical protein